MYECLPKHADGCFHWLFDSLKEQRGPRPFCVQFACSPCAHLGFPLLKTIPNIDDCSPAGVPGQNMGEHLDLPEQCCCEGPLLLAALRGRTAGWDRCRDSFLPAILLTLLCHTGGMAHGQKTPFDKGRCATFLLGQKPLIPASLKICCVPFEEKDKSP